MCDVRGQNREVKREVSRGMREERGENREFKREKLGVRYRGECGEMSIYRVGELKLW